MTISLIFLGAGASRPFGIPTMQELVNEFEKELDKTSENWRLYSKIKSIQEKWYKSKNVDIESIYSVIDGLAKNVKPTDFEHLPLYYIANKGIMDDFSDDDRKIAKELKTNLESFIKNKCKPPISESEILEIYENTYEPLFTNLKDTEQQGFLHGKKFNARWKAYTTNYDLIFEGFWADFTTLHDFFVKEGDSLHYIFNPLQTVKDICLIKLHGSIDWLKRKNDGRIMKKGMTITRHQTEGEVMIFPIQQKNLYLYPWIDQFLHFKQALQETQEWIVIGYAFNDEFILNVFKEALPPGKEFIIINPHAEKLKQLFPKEFHDSIIPLPMRFGGKLFKEQLTDFRKQIRELELEVETKAEALELEVSEPNQIFYHNKGSFTDSKLKNVNKISTLELRSNDNGTKKATAKMNQFFGHPFKQTDFVIYANTPEPVFLRAYYHKEPIRIVTTESTKDSPPRGHKTIVSILPSDMLVR